MDNDDLDLLLRRMWREELSRRQLLKGAFYGAAAVSIGGLLAACAPGKGPAGTSAAPASAAPSVAELKPPTATVNLEFWNPFTGPDGPHMKTLVDQFNAETSTVKVKVTTQADYYTKIRAAATSKRLPNVAIMHLDQIPLQAADGVITPIDDLVSLLGLSGGDFTDAVWTGTQYNGKRYSIPLDNHTLSFFWNKDLFTKAGLDPEKPPTDKASFEDAAKKLTAGGVSGFMVVASGGGGPFLSGIQWASYFYQGGGQWTNADYTQATYNSQAGMQASDWMKSLVSDLKVSPTGVESDSEIAAFKQGKNAMVMSGIWETTGYAGALKDKLGAGPIPNIFGGGGVWAGSHTLAVPKRASETADERQAAYYFIDWISKHSLEWAKAGQIPARKSVRESADFKAIPNISKIAEQIDKVKFPPAIPAVSDLLFGPGGAGESNLLVINGKKSSKDALDASVARYTKILTDNKKKYGY